ELLELSLIESGEQPVNPRPTDVSALLREAVRRLDQQAARAAVKVSVEGEDTGLCNVDPARLERAVVNLVQNAIKFTPPGGRVTVTGRRTPEELVITVEDTGIGIAREELPRIFERFYKADHSRASGGSGLGLALVKHAIEAQGGTVRVESTPGTGSTFTVSLPLGQG